MPSLDPTQMSAAERLALLPKEKQKEILRQLPETELRNLKYDWKFWARPKQYSTIETFLSSHHSYCTIMSGRGFGKTKTGSEWCRYVMENGIYRTGGIVGPTSGDVRNVMITGPAGILSVCPPDNFPHYSPANKKITWPNGGEILIYSADEPNRLRGANSEFIWADELAAWGKAEDCWNMISFGLRIGPAPKALITTTPQPIKVLVDILEDPSNMLIEGSTYENRGNLNKRFYDKIISKYEGTNLGDQEIHGKLLKNLGGLFKPEYILRIDKSKMPLMVRIVVSVDPATKVNKNSDDTGLAVTGKGIDGNYYLLHVEGEKRTPKEWADRVAELYKDYSADLIIAENNNGGLMVESTIQQGYKSLPVKVIHASRGKLLRAEPISLLYQKGRMYHVNHDGPGYMDKLINESMKDAEKQMFIFKNLQTEKNDMVDAIVYGFAELSENDNMEFQTSAVAGIR
jgi:predicted phage terminase large subunit-like protein